MIVSVFNSCKSTDGTLRSNDQLDEKLRYTTNSYIQKRDQTKIITCRSQQINSNQGQSASRSRHKTE